MGKRMVALRRILPLCVVVLVFSAAVNSEAITSTSAPTLRLPFDGSFPIVGNSYECGTHQSNPGTKYLDKYAIDFGLPPDSRVTAVAPGYAYSGSDGVINYGHYIYIVHPGGFVSVYAHLNRTYVSNGVWVSQGQHIADSGSTGGSEGPHLHFSLRKNATSISDGEAAIPEPMSGYQDFKYYGYTSARDCQLINGTKKFNASNALLRQTLLAMEFPLMGISYNSYDNNNPNPSGSSVRTQVFNLNNQQVADIRTNAVYHSIPGKFVNYVNLGANFPAGTYYARVRMDNTLGQSAYGIKVVTGLETFVQLGKIIGGDIDNNNRLDILDYNILISCFGSNTCNYKTQSDLDRDGDIDGVDYNIWLRYNQDYQGQ